MEDVSKYAHSPAHLAVLQRDHVVLKGIVASLPRLAKAGEVNTETESLAAEKDADAVCAVIDRRDVPGRETPLHLAVRLNDATSAEILMSAGADWSLQNENGWSALQEAVCAREENIAMIIARHYQPLAWAKWCRRLPRIVASAARIRDFYMEISFHFESSVIPFIGRIAPSDTYRIWKRGSNLRADMTLAGFDGFHIQRSDQTFLFFGEGYFWEGGNRSLPPGSLIVLSHKKKEITNAFEGAGVQPSEAAVAREVACMSRTNMYRPGIDVTQAEFVPHLNWRRQERTESVGAWKAKVYDMLHVSLSVKSRRVPGAMTDEELFAVNDDDRIANGVGHDEYSDVLTAEERMQLDSAFHKGNSDGLENDEESDFQDRRENYNGHSFESCESNVAMKEEKSWFGWSKKGLKNTGDDPDDLKIRKKFLTLAPDDRKQWLNESSLSSSEFLREDIGNFKKSNDKRSKKKKKKGAPSGSKNESEYKKGLRPVLWLTPDFPLKTDELLPLLDILANKVKAVRRLREVLTTKFPPGTFPVKIAIPIFPTIRVLATFTKFEELQPMEEFSTPLSSPVHFQDAKSKDFEGSTSWISWMKGSRGEQLSENRSFRDDIDPFYIPSDYAWVDANEKKRRMKAKRAKDKKHKKPVAAKNPDYARQFNEDIKD
ncbi:ankyrin repeat domain-containing 13A [Olea europaea subsp. europaea]|uniref:Ankyrin repeat domain-containing 13A n=1 Tax=Olea europaea subsp. europaea TaxID=158383 RepID=A0A8S0PX21_OLEEU|nr:ankyrin repeat domain-containing 13A [Olea europaea subsp. europaea]